MHNIIIRPKKPVTPPVKTDLQKQNISCLLVHMLINMIKKASLCQNVDNHETKAPLCQHVAKHES